MKFITYIFIFLIISSCLNPEEEKSRIIKTFSYEVLKCVDEKFEPYKINITQTLQDYEKYLIKTKILKDTSVESYLTVINHLINNQNQSNSYYNYPTTFPKDTMIVNSYITKIKECSESFGRNLNQKQAEYNKSIFNKYRQPIESFIETIPFYNKNIDNNSLNIDSIYFQTRYFKNGILSLIYNDEYYEGEKRKREALTKFTIIITKDEHVVINNIEIMPSKLSEYINIEKEKFTAYEKENYIVKLMVESKTRMSIVKSVRDELRKTNSLKIYYSTIN